MTDKNSIGPQGDRTFQLKSAARVAAELYGLKAIRVEVLEGGRVNESFRVVSDKGVFALQRLSDFFGDGQNLGFNWRQVHMTVAARSALKHVPLPPVYNDLEGRLISRLPDEEGFWRLTGFIEGRPPVKNPDAAQEAARLLGRLHKWLNIPAPLELASSPGIELTNQHLPSPWEFEALEDQYKGHPRLAELKGLIDQAAEAARQLPYYPGFCNAFKMHDVVIHGDCKSENFLFSPEGRAICLLDWDSVGYGQILIDIAEMLRSWGLSGAAGDGATRENFKAVLAGYAQTGLTLQPDDLDILPPILRGIALNLCRRYLADALAEVFFKWDHRAYPSLFHQNRARAEKMLSLSDYLLNNEVVIGETLITGYKEGLKLKVPEVLSNNN